jgi:hypothetical protein
MEIWKDIKGYEGHYQINNFGKVKSLQRQITTSIGSTLKIKESIRKTSISNSGYEMITLTSNRVNKSFSIHSLVFRTFKGDYEGIINHLDENKLNNNISNLEITNHRGNAVYSIDKTKTKSNYIGVYSYFNTGKYTARITINKKRENLGVFNTEEEASEAYQKRLKEIE